MPTPRPDANLEEAKKAWAAADEEWLKAAAEGNTASPVAKPPSPSPAGGRVEDLTRQDSTRGRDIDVLTEEEAREAASYVPQGPGIPRGPTPQQSQAMAAYYGTAKLEAPQAAEPTFLEAGARVLGEGASGALRKATGSQTPSQQMADHLRYMSPQQRDEWEKQQLSHRRQVGQRSEARANSIGFQQNSVRLLLTQNNAGEPTLNLAATAEGREPALNVTDAVSKLTAAYYRSAAEKQYGRVENVPQERREALKRAAATSAYRDVTRAATIGSGAPIYIDNEDETVRYIANLPDVIRPLAAAALPKKAATYSPTGRGQLETTSATNTGLRILNAPISALSASLKGGAEYAERHGATEDASIEDRYEYGGLGVWGGAADALRAFTSDNPEAAETLVRRMREGPMLAQHMWGLANETIDAYDMDPNSVGSKALRDSMFLAGLAGDFTMPTPIEPTIGVAKLTTRGMSGLLETRRWAAVAKTLEDAANAGEAIDVSRIASELDRIDPGVGLYYRLRMAQEYQTSEILGSHANAVNKAKEAEAVAAQAQTTLERGISNLVVQRGRQIDEYTALADANRRIAAEVSDYRPEGIFDLKDAQRTWQEYRANDKALVRAGKELNDALVLDATKNSGRYDPKAPTIQELDKLKGRLESLLSEQARLQDSLVRKLAPLYPDLQRATPSKPGVLAEYSTEAVEAVREMTRNVQKKTLDDSLPPITPDLESQASKFEAMMSGDEGYAQALQLYDDLPEMRSAVALAIANTLPSGLNRQRYLAQIVSEVPISQYAAVVQTKNYHRDPNRWLLHKEVIQRALKEGTFSGEEAKAARIVLDILSGNKPLSADKWNEAGKLARSPDFKNEVALNIKRNLPQGSRDSHSIRASGGVTDRDIIIHSPDPFPNHGAATPDELVRALVNVKEDLLQKHEGYLDLNWHTSLEADGTLKTRASLNSVPILSAANTMGIGFLTPLTFKKIESILPKPKTTTSISYKPQTTNKPVKRTIYQVEGAKSDDPLRWRDFMTDLMTGDAFKKVRKHQASRIKALAQSNAALKRAETGLVITGNRLQKVLTQADVVKSGLSREYYGTLDRLVKNQAKALDALKAANVRREAAQRIIADMQAIAARADHGELGAVSRNARRDTSVGLKPIDVLGQSFNVTSTQIANLITREWNFLKNLFDPKVEKYGEVSLRLSDIIDASAQRVAMMNDDIGRALAKGDDTVVDLMATSKPLPLFGGRASMFNNAKDGETPWQAFIAHHRAAQEAGEASPELINKALHGLSTSYAPSGVSITPEAAGRLRKWAVARLSTIDTGTPDNLRAFLDDLKQQTKIVLNGADETPRALGFAAANIGKGAVLKWMSDDLTKSALGRIPEQAVNDINSIFGDAKGAKGIADLKQAAQYLNEIGVPITRQGRQGVFDRAGMQTYRLIQIGKSPEGENIFAMEHLIAEIDQRCGDITKDTSRKHEGIASIREWKMAQRGAKMVQLLRTSTVQGLIIPDPSHWVNTIVGDFSQIWLEMGAVQATKGTAKTLAGTLVSPFLTKWDRFQRSKGNLPSTFSSMLQPDVNKVLQRQSGTIRFNNGTTASYEDIGQWAVEDRILDAFVLQEFLSTIDRVTPTAWKSSIRGWQSMVNSAAVVISQRQRLNLYIDLLKQGATRGEAATATRRALYDWGNGITRWEAASIARVVPFWRYQRLALQQMNRAILDPFVRRPGGLGLDVSRPANLRNQLTIKERFLGDNDEGENPLEADLEMMWQLLRPNYLQSRALLDIDPLSIEEQLRLKKQGGRTVTHSQTMLPPATTFDIMEIHMAFVNAMCGMAAEGMGVGGFTPDASQEILWQPALSMLGPGTREAAGGLIDNLGGDSGIFLSGKLSYAEYTMMEQWNESMGSLPLLNHFAVPIGYDAAGRPQVSKIGAFGLRNLPILLQISPIVKAATETNPEGTASDFLLQWTGLNRTYYYDPRYSAFTLRQRLIQNELRDLENAATGAQPPEPLANPSEED